MIVDWISRFLHVATAITLIGGSGFLRFVLLPAAARLDPAAHETLAAELTARWKRIVHLGIVLFLASGLYNYYRAIPDHRGDSLYHALVGTKILLALIVFFLAAALVGRAAALEPIRRQRRRSLAALVLLATLIVGISAWVKVRGVPAPVDVPPPGPQVAQPDA
jgi:uncharacterized membrane protein